MDLSPDMNSSKTGSCKTWRETRLTIVVCFPKQLQGDISHQLQNSTWESLKTKKKKEYKAQLDTFTPFQTTSLVSWCLTLQSPWVSRVLTQVLLASASSLINGGPAAFTAAGKAASFCRVSAGQMKSGPTIQTKLEKEDFWRGKEEKCVGHGRIIRWFILGNFPDEAGVKKCEPSSAISFNECIVITRHAMENWYPNGPSVFWTYQPEVPTWFWFNWFKYCSTAAWSSLSWQHKGSPSSQDPETCWCIAVFKALGFCMFRLKNWLPGGWVKGDTSESIEDKEHVIMWFRRSEQRKQPLREKMWEAPPFHETLPSWMCPAFRLISTPKSDYFVCPSDLCQQMGFGSHIRQTVDTSRWRNTILALATWHEKRRFKRYYIYDSCESRKYI